MALQELVWVFTYVPSGQGFRSTQARPRCCRGAAAQLRPPIPQRGSPVRPGLDRHSPGRPGLAGVAAPHTSGPPLQSRGSLPGRSRSGMQPALRITEARAPGLRELGRSAGPPPAADGEDGLSRVSARSSGHGEFRSRAAATRSAVEPTCLSRQAAPSRVAQGVGAPGTRLMTTRYPHRIRKSQKNKMPPARPQAVLDSSTYRF